MGLLNYELATITDVDARRGFVGVHWTSGEVEDGLGRGSAKSGMGDGIAIGGQREGDGIAP